MPKVKTRKAALKRFKLTATGKIRFKKCGLRHILTKKSADRKRKKGLAGYLTSADTGRIMRAIPYGTDS
ncbi:MAG: 50S ribosomal protein L35 [Oligoflexia bacterium]|nr:50S ribosomal protein L35 [Oligoflexia bacterium]